MSTKPVSLSKTNQIVTSIPTKPLDKKKGRPKKGADINICVENNPSSTATSTDLQEVAWLASYLATMRKKVNPFTQIPAIILKTWPKSKLMPLKILMRR